MNITLQHLTKTFPVRGRKAEGETTAVLNDPKVIAAYLGE